MTYDLQRSAAWPPAANSLCFVVPTYNRSDALITCLRHLEAQTAPSFEVIVVDDGSIDDTPAVMAAYLASTSLPVSYARTSNGGPARARNLAVALTVCDLCLFIGDDIFCSPGFAATHLDFHATHPQRNVAALGLTRWSQTGQTVTPFMRWLEDSGSQFAYGALLAGQQPTWEHFYTSNLSVKTQLLRDHPFDERFTRAMVEDAELGYRLTRLEDLQLHFLPQALADHLHPTDFLTACRRTEAIGYYWRMLEEIWPEITPPARAGAAATLRDLFYRNTWLLAHMTTLTNALNRVSCPNPLLQPVLRLHLGVGYRRRLHANNP